MRFGIGIPAITAKLLIALLLLLPNRSGLATGNDCQALAAQFLAPDPNIPLRQLQGIKQIVGMAFNVLNLMESRGSYQTDATTGRRVWVEAKTNKPVEQQIGVAESIKRADPDFVVMTEVESQTAVQTFVQTHLSNRYQSVLVEGNDSRDINIALLVKKDAPLAVEIRSNRETMWPDPQNPSQQIKIFSRDVPVWIMRPAIAQPTNNSPPLFIVAGIHNKSQRDRAGDPMSVALRAAQMAATQKILKDLEAEFPGTPIATMGDANADINNAREFSDFKQKSGFRDAFDLLPQPPPIAQRTTHTYHPTSGPTSYSQLDVAFLNAAFAPYLVKAHVQPYLYPKGHPLEGQPMPLAQTFQEREQQPSDHLPLVVQFNFERLYQDYLRRAGAAGAGNTAPTVRP